MGKYKKWKNKIKITHSPSPTYGNGEHLGVFTSVCLIHIIRNAFTSLTSIAALPEGGSYVSCWTTFIGKLRGWKTHSRSQGEWLNASWPWWFLASGFFSTHNKSYDIFHVIKMHPLHGIILLLLLGVMCSYWWKFKSFLIFPMKWISFEYTLWCVSDDFFYLEFSKANSLGQRW